MGTAEERPELHYDAAMNRAVLFDALPDEFHNEMLRMEAPIDASVSPPSLLFLASQSDERVEVVALGVDWLAELFGGRDDLRILPSAPFSMGNIEAMPVVPVQRRPHREYSLTLTVTPHISCDQFL